AARIGGAIPLHLGDTYLDPLPAARAEAQCCRQHPRLHNYAPVQGEPELLDAIVEKVERRSGVTLARDCIQVMSGATAGFGVICCALLDPGDEVLLPAPLWPLMRGAIKLRGAVPVEVPFFSELDRPGFDPIAALEQACTPRTVAIYLNSPHNPTGRVLPDALIAELSAFALRHDLWVLSDEVYEDLWFAAPTPSIWARPELRDRTIASHSVSKAYALAGARVGFSHGPPEIMAVIRGVQTFYSYCAPRPMQLGAARALREGEAWLADARARYARAGALAARALGVRAPAGGTFLLFELEPHLRGAEAPFSWLERCVDAGVTLMPGSAAGRAFDRWARLCFTTVPEAELALALERLRPLLAH
ncbi:MAG TPA: pyridoxal phosphate-dependent aminotransferase, partial [Polyangiales bacterium]|nr:pyridoxal phosphate-dependent aminotransferase [Polyangiales bacterium]